MDENKAHEIYFELMKESLTESQALAIISIAIARCDFKSKSEIYELIKRYGLK
jgi:hypothetical protein